MIQQVRHFLALHAANLASISDTLYGALSSPAQLGFVTQIPCPPTAPPQKKS